MLISPNEEILKWDTDCKSITIVYRWGEGIDYNDFLPTIGSYNNVSKLPGNPIHIDKSQIRWFIQQAKRQGWSIICQKGSDGILWKFEDNGDRIYPALPFKSLYINLKSPNA